MMSTVDFGKNGEEYACRYLKSQGYCILKRNFRCHRMGELDIIACKDSVVHFIEVKTRTSTRFGMPQEAVTLSKQRTIRRCAEYYLATQHLLQDIPLLSFDIIAIIVQGGQVTYFEHLVSCF